MRIAVIGAGNVGSTLAAAWVAAGHEVRIANGRAPETLADVEARTGAKALALDTVAQLADVVSISVPFPAIASVARSIRPGLPADVTVIDTGNYVPGLRDAQIDSLDVGAVESVWTQGYFDRPLVKAFNCIAAEHLRTLGRAPGVPGRIALPIAGDALVAKARVATLVDDAGFDVVDAGSLSESWRQQPGTPVYTADLDGPGVVRALAAAERGQSGVWRAAMAARRAV